MRDTARHRRCQLAGGDKPLYFRLEAQQQDALLHERRALEPELVDDALIGHGLVAEQLKRVRLLDWVHVLALQVLDDGTESHFLRADLDDFGADIVRA